MRGSLSLVLFTARKRANRTPVFTKFGSIWRYTHPRITMDFKKIAFTFGIRRAAQYITKGRKIIPEAQANINTWATDSEIIGTPAFDEQGVLQQGFAIDGWTLDNRYFCVDYFKGGAKVATSRWSNYTGKRKG